MALFMTLHLPDLRSTRLAFGVFLLIAAASLATAASLPSETGDACVDRNRLNAVEQDAEYAPSRLPNLRYRCLKLKDGTDVLFGEGGTPDRPPVLLIHGLGDNAHKDWQPVLPDLQERFHVLVLDLPGFGSSAALPGGYSFPGLAAAIAEVMDDAKVTRAHVVGHSLGGAVSLYFAHVFPRRVDRLVLVNAAGILHKAVFVKDLARLDLPEVGVSPIDGLLSTIERRLNGLGGRVLQRAADGFDISRWLHEHPDVRSRLLGSFTHVDAAYGLIVHDFTRAIRETQTPTTIIWGGSDEIAPLRTGELLAGRLPDARLSVLDGVGHMPMSEQPVRFLDVLIPALVAPLPAKFAVSVPAKSQGHVTCRDRSHAVFTGRIERLSLTNCDKVRIEHALLGAFAASGSTVTLTHATINSAGTALSAKDSRITATDLTLRGRVAIDAENSEIDFAGARLYASEQGIKANGRSRIYFSVSESRTPELSGDLHTIWRVRATAMPAAK
jgi:pimeloyl-ACP methyl ester carboxylesterase